MNRIDRRDAIKLIGLGAVAVGSGSLSLLRGSMARGRSDVPDGESHPEKSPLRGDREQWWLLDPVSTGSTVRGCRVKSVTDIVDGVITVGLERDDGNHFEIRICRRDDSEQAPRPVARSAHYDFFLPNGGKGDMTTDEREGLSVLAIAAIVQRNETRRAPLPLETLREHWRRG